MGARRFTGRLTALVVAAIAAIGVAGFLGVSAASASTGLTVTLGASSGDNASATCNSSGDIVLTTGADTTATYAEADVNGVSGTVLSGTAEPSFSTDQYAAGSPRWVVELSNNNSLWGYPSNSGLNGTDFAWAVNNDSTYTDYATAYAAADASTATITDAFIVADGDQPSTTDTISGATFNGEPLSCAAAPTTGSSSPTPTPSASASASASATPTTSYPVGGVQTGGGQPVTSPWLPLGLGLAGLAVVLIGTGGALALRKQFQGR